MSFRLAVDEAPADGIRRVAAQEVGLALRALRQGGAPGNQTGGIHDARRALKRVRAALRLVRPALGGGVYRLENAAYREAGHLMSAIRDAEVVVATAERFGNGGDPGACLVHRLRRRRDRIARSHLPSERRRGLVRELEAARRRIAGWPVRGAGWEVLGPGLRRTYTAGARALRGVAGRNATPGRYHEWRKRAKDLRHQVELLHDAWPTLLGAVADELHDLTDLLGTANDLQLLMRTLEAEPALTEGLEGTLELRSAATRDQSAAWREALALGRRLWTEAPAVFTRRMEGYWRAWTG